MYFFFHEVYVFSFFFYIILCMFKPAVNQTIILFHSSSILYKLPSIASLAHSKSCLLRRFFASLCTYFSVSWSVCFCHPLAALYICLCFILVSRVLLYSMPAKQTGLADTVTHRALHFSVAWYYLEDMPCLGVGRFHFIVTSYYYCSG